MRDSSKELQTLMSNNRALFYQKGKITFADGREKELGKKDFFMQGNNFSQGAGETSFPLGVAISNSITISIVNNDDRFSDYDFYSARIQLYCCCDLSESTESWLIGTYTVVEPEVYGDSITLNAVDDMHNGEIDYSTNLNFPTTAQAVLIDSCRSCGVFLNTTNFANNNFVINEKPEGITHRELWGYIAMIAGGNAIMDNQNRLNIKTWQMQDIPTVDGGKFDSDTPYSSGDNTDGGTFSDYASGDTLDGGTFTDKRNYHFFYKAPSIEIGTDDVVITGIQTEVDEKVYLRGSDGYVLSVSNPLIEGNPQYAVNLIGNILIGLRFRPFSMNHSAYPLVEFGDTCLVADRKGNLYKSLVTDTTFVYFGATTISCNAESPMRNSSKYNSQAAQTIIAERKKVEKKLSSVDLAIEQITKEIANSSGFYETTVEQEDKSKIFYMHNKPELSDSSIVWRVSSEVLSVSTDGGKTWNAGIDASGNAIMNVVSANGINADWINAGSIDASKIDVKNLDASNIKSGTMSCDRLDGGTIEGQEINGGSVSGATITNGDVFKVDKNSDVFMNNPYIGTSIFMNFVDSYFGNKTKYKEIIGQDLIYGNYYPRLVGTWYSEKLYGYGYYIDLKDGYGASFTSSNLTLQPINSNASLNLQSAIGSHSSVISANWKDNSFHNVITRESDGLTTRLGWAGTSNYKTVTNLRGQTVLCNGSTTWTSDKNLKSDIVELDERYDVFFDNLKPTSYKYILGTSGRCHSGYVTQDVEKALEIAGLTTEEFAGVVVVPINERETETDSDNNVVDVELSESNYLLDNDIAEQHNLAYIEFIALNTWQIQKLKKKVSVQEDEIRLLKSEIELLKSEIELLKGGR